MGENKGFLKDFYHFAVANASRLLVPVLAVFVIVSTAGTKIPLVGLSDLGGVRSTD